MPNLVLKTNITIKKPYGLKICVFLALLCGAGMFRNLTKLPDKAGRQDLDGVRVVEHDTNFGGPLVLTHRLP